MKEEATPIPGVGAVIVQDDRLLLVRRGSGASQGLWAVPGGRPRYGESARQAVVRETKEETGLDIEAGEVIWVGDAIGPGDPPAWHYLLVDFAAQAIGGSLAAGDDAAEVRWVRLEEVAELPLTDTMYRLLESLGG